MKTASLHPDIARQFGRADIKISEIRDIAKHLANLMAGVHGFEWEAIVSHNEQSEFILIKPKNGQRGISA